MSFIAVMVKLNFQQFLQLNIFGPNQYFSEFFNIESFILKFQTTFILNGNLFVTL